MSDRIFWKMRARKDLLGVATRTGKRALIRLRAIRYCVANLDFPGCSPRRVYHVLVAQQHQGAHQLVAQFMLQCRMVICDQID